MYNFFFLFIHFFYLPEEVKRNVQKFHVLTEKESIEKGKKKRRVIYRGETTLNLYLHAARDRFHGYLSHSRRIFRRFFTPLLFGCSPPPSPPAFSPPLRSRSPSLPSSSFLACFKEQKVMSPKNLLSVSTLRYILIRVFFFPYLPKPIRFVESSNHD